MAITTGPETHETLSRFSWLQAELICEVDVLVWTRPLLPGTELNVHFRAGDAVDPEPFDNDEVEEEAEDELAAVEKFDDAGGEAIDEDDENEVSGLVGKARPTPYPFGPKFLA